MHPLDMAGDQTREHLNARHQFITAARALHPFANATEHPHDFWLSDISGALSALELPDSCDKCADSDPADMGSRYPVKNLGGGRWRYLCHVCGHGWTCTWGQDRDTYQVTEILPKGTTIYAAVVASGGYYPRAPRLSEAWHVLVETLDDVESANTPTLTVSELAEQVAEAVGVTTKTVRELIRTAVKSGDLYQETITSPPPRVSYITRHAPQLYVLSGAHRG